jgi:two-component system response regulator WspF
MNIGIVNDMKTSLLTLRAIVERVPDWSVAWEAENGAVAVQRCIEITPDIILMDLIMPVMNGVETTREIMRQTPCAILVVTAGVVKNTPLVYAALGEGALDAVDMPGTEEVEIERLLEKMRKVGKILIDQKQHSRPPPNASRQPDQHPGTPLIAIGASTGGPTAIRRLLQNLPMVIPAAIVVIQHLDQDHTSGFADWLQEETELQVRVAREGEKPVKGLVLVAKTNDHLVLKANGSLHYTREPVDEPYRPSVNEFFASAGLYRKGPIIGVLLTGLGRDGGRGMLALRRLGHFTIAQDEESSVAYGMPRDAAQRRAAVKQLPPEQIGKLIAQRMVNIKTGEPQ